MAHRKFPPTKKAASSSGSKQVQARHNNIPAKNQGPLQPLQPLQASPMSELCPRTVEVMNVMLSAGQPLLPLSVAASRILSIFGTRQVAHRKLPPPRNGKASECLQMGERFRMVGKKRASSVSISNLKLFTRFPIPLPVVPVVGSESVNPFTNRRNRNNRNQWRSGSV